jgi:hypothetical protein
MPHDSYSVHSWPQLGQWYTFLIKWFIISPTSIAGAGSTHTTILATAPMSLSLNYNYGRKTILATNFCSLPAIPRMQ